ncbi:hypothetical protein PQX77_014235 [Marasmius sp. AFHP31]|nr:hypothetical protein PQX77_014235 [Marasmius sp. AFHP31]
MNLTHPAGPSEAARYMHETLLSVLFWGDSFATSLKDQDAESVVSNPYERFTDTRFKTITIDEPTLLAGGGHFIVVESDRSIVDCIYLYQRIFVPTLLPRHSGACSALCIASALDAPHWRPFSDIFTTSHPINAWWNTESFLVSTEQDVLKWLRSRTTAFCVHTPDDGTAIPVFILKVTQEERVWVFFKVVSPNTEDGGTGLDEKMRAAAEACLPHNVFGEPSSEIEKTPKSLSKLSRNAGELGV